MALTNTAYRDAWLGRKRAEYAERLENWSGKKEDWESVTGGKSPYTPFQFPAFGSWPCISTTPERWAAAEVVAREALAAKATGVYRGQPVPEVVKAKFRRVSEKTVVMYYLNQEDFTNYEMQDYTYCSTIQISKMRRIFGLPRRGRLEPWPIEKHMDLYEFVRDPEAMEALIAEGVEDWEIAQYMGVSLETVRRWRKK